MRTTFPAQTSLEHIPCNTGRQHILPMPIISLRGAFALSTLLLVPVLGLLYGVALNVQLLFAALILVSFLLYSTLDALRLSYALKSTELEFALPKQLHSGVTSTLACNLYAPKLSNRTISLRSPSSLPLREIETQWIEADASPDERSPETTATRQQRQYFTYASPLRRGELTFSSVILRVSDPLRVLHWQVTLTLESPVTRKVVPATSFNDAQNIPALIQANAGEVLSHSALRAGREFDSLRHYVHGDDLRKVDWKRSAKGNGLLVKEFRPESHQRIHIILDCGRRLGAIVDQREQIEFATDAAAQLLQFASSSDDEFAFFAFHSEAIASVACRRGNGQQQLIRNALQSVNVGAFESDYQLLHRWVLQERRRSLMLVISSVSNPAGIEAISRALLPARNRHVPVFLALNDTELARLEGSPAKNLLDAYAIAAAREQTVRIQEKLAELQRSGILTTYTDAKGLSHELCKAYVEAKTSGRL